MWLIIVNVLAASLLVVLGAGRTTVSGESRVPITRIVPHSLSSNVSLRGLDRWVELGICVYGQMYLAAHSNRPTAEIAYRRAQPWICRQASG
ncbi:hypothetical protein GY45DRAFT_1329694 [Cubamyces sp. BRFM 1775]|nr:hypothetical protein GY45DRAFT_1329694 [Cubamyces sp. BRFM 1775]